MAQIEYGFNIEKNTFLHISEVNSGLSELVCASCYEKGLKIQLVAAKGEINEHYFKHHNGDGHSGCGGGEGVLHLYVKNRILNEKKIYINDVEYIFSNCQLEYDFLGKKIDVCGFLANGNKIFLEIVVSHSMYNDKEGKEKIQLIQKSGILCYEIMIDETLSKEQIENGLFKNSKIIPKISIYQNNGTDFYFLMSNFTSRILAEKKSLIELQQKNSNIRVANDYLSIDKGKINIEILKLKTSKKEIEDDVNNYFNTHREKLLELEVVKDEIIRLNSEIDIKKNKLNDILPKEEAKLVDIKKELFVLGSKVSDKYNELDMLIKSLDHYKKNESNYLKTIEMYNYCVNKLENEMSKEKSLIYSEIQKLNEEIEITRKELRLYQEWRDWEKDGGIIKHIGKEVGWIKK
jgi:hypothetical protein